MGKKNQELQQKLWELTSNGDTEKIMNENQDLRRKLHEQRTEMQQLKSWKTMARKKYLEQIKEIRDDVQELQSRSRINQFKFQQLNKINQVQKELTLIINSYSYKKDGSFDDGDSVDYKKNRKIFRNGMREIEKLFEIAFDENDQLSHYDISKIIKYVKHSADKNEETEKIIKKLKEKIKNGVNNDLLETLYSISNSFVLNIEFEDIPKHLHRIDEV